jgi:signal transduction histidine kinase
MADQESLAMATGQAMHDLNNLLMVIIGNTELMAENLPADSPEREGLDAILEAALRAQKLSEGLHLRARELLDAA